jgi:hypothetical protein
MKFILICITTLIAIAANAQSFDYLKLQKRMGLDACKTYDAAYVKSSIEALEALDTVSIRKNIKTYYLDLAKFYWLASGDGNEFYLHKCIHHCRAALYHDPEYAPAHWNLAMASSQLNECEQTLNHLDLCFTYTKEKEIDPYTLEQAEMMRKRCEE